MTRFLIHYVPHPEDINQEQWGHNPGQEYWAEVQNSLFMAASINQIVPHTQILDDAGSWCLPAYEYDVEKEKLVVEYVKEATRFMWTWNSFERIVDKLIQGSSKRPYTAKAINYMINSDCDISEKEKLMELVSLLKKACNNNPNIEHKAVSIACKSNSSHLLHIHLCRELRNSMFHEPVSDIEPLDWDRGPSYKAENDDRVMQLRVASRLTLLTIQDILVAYLRHSPMETDRDEDEDEQDFTSQGILSGVKAWQALKYIHLKDPSTCKQIQMDLDLI